jgi:hypothetical protein
VVFSIRAKARGSLNELADYTAASGKAEVQRGHNHGSELPVKITSQLGLKTRAWLITYR